MSFREIKMPKSPARAIALIGVMAATIEVGKLALSFLPNIEVVTLLCALYGYVFGFYGVVAAAIFVCIEPLIYGVGSWVAIYMIYWPLVAFVFMLLASAKVKRRLPLTLIALGLTLFFGVLSAVVDSMVHGIGLHYFKNVFVYYLRGIPFYINQLLCNGAVFPTLFPFFVKKLKLINKHVFLP